MCFTKEKLDVLFLENLEKDVEIVHQKLLDEFNCPVNLDSVCTAQSYLSNIANKKYDVILADYTLPGYNAEAALRQALLVCPDVPFICVSGTIGEEKAVELLKQGAADYVLKDRLGRLSFAIKRAIDAGEEKRNHKRMEESLHDSQHLAHIGSWDRDIIHDKVYWSDECYRIYGLEPKSIKPKGDTFLEYVHPEDREKVSEALNNALTKGLPYKIGFRIVRPDGSNRHVYTKAQLDHDETGKLTRLYGTVQDLTKRKLNEDKTRQHIEFERTILHLAKDFINSPLEQMDSYIMLSMEKVSKYYNADRATIYRYDWEQEKGIRLYKWTCDPDILEDERWTIIHFNDIRDVIESHRKGLPYRSDTIDDVSLTSAYYPTLQKSKAQSVISVPLMACRRVLGAFTISAMQEQANWHGSDISIIKVFCELLTNVLLRRERETALQEANEGNRLMLDSTSDGIMMTNREGLILNINENFASRFGRSKQECIRKDFEEFLSSEKYQDLYKRRYRIMQKVFETGVPEVDEDERDGSIFYNRYHPVFKNGEVHAITIFSTDITDRKRAEEEARAKAESEARLKVTTELFTNVSHEFKTPLSVILIQLELMRLYLDDTQKMHELIDAATQNSYRLNRLVGNLLDITKIDSGFMRMNMTHADIVATIREICESVADYAKAKSIQLTFASETITKPMPLDMDKIERILLNLLSNAIKHTQAEGRIDVIFEDKGDAILICVEDTGEGIPIDKQAAIFDRFAQVDTSLTRKNEGSGIGLALVQSFVKLLGGRIWVESEAGRGSSFFIELPVPQESQTGLAIEMDGYSLKRKVEMELSDLYLNS